MTVSVAFNGTVIDTADTVGNWTAVKITAGGQAPTAVAADAAYEGNNNVTCRSDNKRVYMYTDIGAGNELDFTGGGNADGDMFYIWVNFLASSLLGTQAAGSLGVFMSTNTPSSTNYALWYIEGSDTYTGGWKRFAIDPNKTPSIDNDTFNPASVRYFGAFAQTVATAKYDNFVVDQCAHGKGLIVTGTSTLGLTEELLVNEAANRHGIVTALNASGTAAELLGTVILGDDVGTAAATITDEDAKIFAAEPLYYETTVKASIPLTAMGLSVVGNGTGDTSVILGQAVGTVRGRNGISIVGNGTYDLNFDRDDGAVETSDFFGCSFENLTGTLNLDGVHDFNGNNFSGCASVSIANSAEVKNVGFVSTGLIVLNTSGKLTDSLIIDGTAAASCVTSTLNNVTGNSFTSDGSNHAVELDTYVASMSWDNSTSGYAAGSTGSPVTPTATGNEDIYITATSASDITINVAAGATTPSIRVAGTFTGDVNVVAGQVNLTLTGIAADSSANIAGGAPSSEVRIYEAGTTTEIDGIEDVIETTGGSKIGTFVLTYTYVPATDVDIIIHHYDYQYYRLENVTLGSTDAALPIQQIFDRNYSNP